MLINYPSHVLQITGTNAAFHSVTASRWDQFSAAQEVIKGNINSQKTSRVTENTSGSSFKPSPTFPLPQHATRPILRHIGLLDIGNYTGMLHFNLNEVVSINNSGWKCWGDVSCCQTQNRNLQWSIFGSLLSGWKFYWCLLPESEIFYGSVLVQRCLSVMSNIFGLELFVYFLSSFFPFFPFSSFLF